MKKETKKTLRRTLVALALPLPALFAPVASAATSASGEAPAPITIDFRCLKQSDSAAQPIRLEWRMFSDPGSNWSGGYVRYKGSSRTIPIVPVKTEAGSKPNGGPWESTTTWAEIVDGRIAGQYVVTIQGANIYGFDYRNLRNGKQYSFAQDLDSDDGKKCTW